VRGSGVGLGLRENRAQFSLLVVVNAFVSRTGAAVIAAAEGVATSTESACHSGAADISPVLKATAVPPLVGLGAVRFSLGRSTTQAEIDAVVV